MSRGSLQDHLEAEEDVAYLLLRAATHTMERILLMSILTVHLSIIYLPILNMNIVIMLKKLKA